MSSTQASITSASSARRDSRPTDSAMTRIASAGSMKQSIMGATIGAAPDGKTVSCNAAPAREREFGPGVRYRRPVLADHSWLWALIGLVALGALLGSGGYRRLAAAARRRALERRLV